MLQANLISPQSFKLEQVEVPVPNSKEAVVRVAQAGICGSDLHAYYGKHPFISCPIVPGHEFVGVVEKVGDGNSDLEGKRVTVLPSLVCGECYNCRIGRFNICDSLKVIGCQAPGAFAEYVVVPKDKIYHLPEEFSWDQGVLVEPVAVGVHAVRRIAKIAGSTVLVLGAGTIGLAIIAVLKSYGVAKIIVSDLNENRLRLAERLGADQVINPSKVNLEGFVRENDEIIDVTFECVGVKSTINDAIILTRKGGDVVIVGVYEDDVVVKMGLVQDKEINLIGTLMYDGEDYREAIRLVGNQPIVTELITHRFPLQKVSDAFEYATSHPEDTIKVIIEVDSSI